MKKTNGVLILMNYEDHWMKLEKPVHPGSFVLLTQEIQLDKFYHTKTSKKSFVLLWRRIFFFLLMKCTKIIFTAKEVNSILSKRFLWIWAMKPKDFNLLHFIHAPKDLWESKPSNNFCLYDCLWNAKFYKNNKSCHV